MSFFRIPSPSGGAERAKKGRTGSGTPGGTIKINSRNIRFRCISRRDLRVLLPRTHRPAAVRRRAKKGRTENIKT